jgi:hypothetical protein
MTPSQTAKQLGCKSLVQVSEVTEIHINTLKGWHKRKPKLFEIICLGVLEKLKNGNS